MEIAMSQGTTPFPRILHQGIKSETCRLTFVNEGESPNLLSMMCHKGCFRRWFSFRY